MRGWSRGANTRATANRQDGADRHCNGDCHLYDHVDTNAHGDRQTRGAAYGYTAADYHTYAHTNTNLPARRCPNADLYRNPNAHAHSDRDRYSNSHLLADAYRNRYANTHIYANAD